MHAWQLQNFPETGSILLVDWVKKPQTGAERLHTGAEIKLKMAFLLFFFIYLKKKKLLETYLENMQYCKFVFFIFFRNVMYF